MSKRPEDTPWIMDPSLSLSLFTTEAVLIIQLFEIKNKHYILPYRWNKNNDINSTNISYLNTILDLNSHDPCIIIFLHEILAYIY